MGQVPAQGQAQVLPIVELVLELGLLARRPTMVLVQVLEQQVKQEREQRLYLLRFVRQRLQQLEILRYSWLAQLGWQRQLEPWLH